MAGTRLFVHQDIFEQVITGIKAMAESFKIGHGLDPDKDFGPLISDTQRKRVMSYIQTGIDEGAELITGGKIAGEKGFFIQPTIFTQVHGDMKIAKEEIFGPVLCAQSFGDNDLENIAQQANDTSYGLSASVWTQDISVAHKLSLIHI